MQLVAGFHLLNSGNQVDTLRKDWPRLSLSDARNAFVGLLGGCTSFV